MYIYIYIHIDVYMYVILILVVVAVCYCYHIIVDGPRGVERSVRPRRIRLSFKLIVCVACCS